MYRRCYSRCYIYSKVQSKCSTYILEFIVLPYDDLIYMLKLGLKVVVCLIT